MLNLQVKKFQKGNVNTWDLTKQKVPHALSLLKRQDLITNIALEKSHEFMTLLGNICLTCGNFYQALEACQSSLKVAEHGHKQHPQLQKSSTALAESYHNIGSSLQSLGKYDEALENHQKALEIWRKVYGENHPAAATSYNNIGASLISLGEYSPDFDS